MNIDTPPYNKLFEAIEKGSLSEVKLAIEHGFDVNEHDDRPLVGAGNAPLHVAANLGNEEIVAYLLKKGAAIDAKCENGWTPLIRACNAGNTGAAILLVESGAQVSLKNNEGYTAYGRIPSTNKELIAYIQPLNGQKMLNKATQHRPAKKRRAGLAPLRCARRWLRRYKY